MLCSCGWFVLSQSLDTRDPQTAAQLQVGYALQAVMTFQRK